MSVFEIVTDEEQLSDWSTEIDPQKENAIVRKIVNGLKDTMRENNLVSLSAPQIGFKRRIIAIKFGEDNIVSFLNPIVTSARGIDLGRETCPSLPNREFAIPRNNEISITFQTPLGDIRSKKLIGLAARTFLHEFDHLNGNLVSDIGLEITEDFDKMSDEDKSQLLMEYMDSLDEQKKELEEEIKSNPELKRIDDALKFMEDVKSGNTKVQYVPVEEEIQEKIIEKNKQRMELENEDKNN